MSFFFEDYSALVVSQLLDVPRNNPFTIEQIAKNTGISEESILPFFQNLQGLGLIINHVPTQEEISDYRMQLSKAHKTQAQTVAKTTKEKLPMDVSNAEMDYANKVGGITSVMFELTYRCSEKCIHCYNIGATRNDSEVNHRGDLVELSISDYKRIIDELCDEGLVKVCLSGGDPFAKSIVWDIIDYLHEKEIAFDVFTNGQSIVNDVERLANYFPRLIGVSIYSGNPSTHDKITRVRGSWEKSLSVVKQLSEHATPTVLKCCVMRPNVKDYHTVMKLGKEYGLTVQYELNVTDSIDGDKCASRYLRLPPDILEIVLRDANTPMYVGKEAPNFGGYPKDMDKNGCGAGMNTFCITPDGHLIPCCAFHMEFGNLREEPLAKIMKESKELRYWRSLTLSDYEECGTHDYCAYCNLCPGNNHSEHGTPTKAGENNCFMAKCRWRLATKMKDGHDPLQGRTPMEVLADIPSPMHYEKIRREL